MIKKILALFLCVIMLLPMLAACDKNGDIPDGMQSVTLEGEPFILYVPEQWTDNRDSGISSAYYSIEKSILVSARYYPCSAEVKDAGIAAYVEKIAEQNASSLSGYALVGEIKDASLGKQDAKRYEYTYNYGGEGGHKTTAIQYYTFYGEDAIVLSMYIASEHLNDEYLETFDKIRSCFELCEKNAKKDANDNIVDKNTPDGMKKASDEDVQYACYVPESWVTDLNDKLTYAYFPEKDSDSNPNITVTCFSPSIDNITAKQYFEESEIEYKKNIAGYERLGEPSERKVAERDALSYQYKAKYGESEYKIMQTVLIYNGLAYSITYTARADVYDTHLDDVNKILDNFRFR